MAIRGSFRCGPVLRSGAVRNFLSLAALAALALAIAAPAGAVSKFSIGPSRVEAQWKPGTEETTVIEAVNQGDDDLRLKSYGADFEIDEAGEIDYPRSGPGPRSCAGWFRFNPQTLEIPKGTSGPVRATARIPADAAGNYRCVLFLEDVPPPSKVKRKVFAVQMNARLGVIVYVTVGPVGPPAVRVEQLSARGRDDGKLEAEAVISHVSGSMARVVGKWELVGAAGTPVESGESAVPLLPEHRRRVTWIASPPPGDYQLRLTLDFGAEKRIVAETPVTVSAPGPAGARKN